jgi:hypothetical protein
MNTTITNGIITLERDLAKDPPDSTLTGLELVPIEVLPPEPFAREAAWIRAKHESLGHASLVTIARSAAVGEELSRIKAELKAALGPGKWSLWTKRNLPGISDRTIRRYMEIFHRYREPLAYEDPEAFLAGIYGNLELPPPEEENDDASTPPPSVRGAYPGRIGAVIDPATMP